MRSIKFRYGIVSNKARLFLPYRNIVLGSVLTHREET